MASVDNAVSQITVTPTKSDSDASVEYLDGNDAAISDADGAATDHQVALEVGENTIKVKVTAEDDATTETYTVVVTRQAQLADVTLISNLGQSSAGSGDFTNDQAQAFTTGSNSGGYSLTKVVINSLLGLGADFTVSVHENDSGAPGTSLGTLTNPTVPDASPAADHEFTHSGIDLAASTTYFIVVDVGASSTSYLIYNTNSDAEDTGGATGWSIGDSSLYRSQSSTGSWTTWAQSKRISMTGTVTAEVTGPGAALVSNVGQTAATGAAQVSTSQSQAQGFTTGSDSGGYTLGSVELAVSSFSGTASDITVSIYSESSGNPGTVVHTLTTPASISAAVTTFTAPSGATLAASTTYYVVISTTSSGISLSRTDATAEDTGGASGWSIADSRRFLGGSGWNTTTSPIRMRVNGDAATSTNSPATGAPTITGTPVVGELLTADISNIGDSDGIADADFEYQWIVFDGTTDSDISGATGETYRPLLAHLDQTIKVRVTFDDDDDNAESLTSAPTAAVTASTYGQVIWAATLTVEEETVAAGTFFGYSLISDRGSLEPYTFTHDGNSTTVTALQYLEGGLLRFTLSGNLGSADFNLYLDGAPFLIEPPGTAFEISDHGLTWTDEQEVEVRLTVNRAATGAPAITGKPEVGQTLTADASAIEDPDGRPADADLDYQWVRSDGVTDEDIDGATDSTYTLVEADAGKTITVRVSFTDNAKFPESLTSAATAAVTVPVAAGETALVSNMNQTTSGSANSILHDGAQAFTTGTNSFGYTLESVEISLTVGGSPFPAHTLSIWTESSNNPGSSLGTLTNPDPVVNGVNTYTTTDGISLSANTTYFIVVDNSPNAGDSGRIAVTGSDSEDSGAASGWSIGDGRVYRDHDSTGSWGIFNNSLKIRINGQVIVPPPEVPADSSLVPDGLGPGDQFRLIFLSSETRTAEATDIATYNVWVQGLAANGHADIQDHSSTFRVVGSTAAVDARDNTSTTYTASDKGVAIYWLGGDKAADDYEDFYDETWDEEASMRDESGTAVTAPSSVFTGSNHDGTTTGRPLGTNVVTVGAPNSTIANDGPLSSDVFNASTGDSHLYALSGVFEVGAIEVPADWSLVPSGLQEGDQFRLLFISSAHRTASPSAIATYNTWVQDQAANGHTDIQDYSSSFRAVGSTEDMDARDNTYTTYTSSDKGVAIYWLGGNKVADDYEDFYDEDWDEEASMKNESGTAESGVTAWTGSDHDGTEMLQGTPGTSRALGNSNNAWVRFGKTDSASHGPLSGATANRTGNKRIYGLSGVFEVVAGNNPATGAPTITGTAQVGGVLTANLSNVTDPDGLVNVSYSYQWIADDGTTETDIDHATGETYRPITADEDKTVKVRVSFTDDEGNPESLTSAATGAVSPWDKGELIWSALLTVGEYDTGGPIVFGFTTGSAGSLEPPTFTFASTDITITTLAYNTPGSTLQLNAAMADQQALGSGAFGLYLDEAHWLVTNPAFQPDIPIPLTVEGPELDRRAGGGGAADSEPPRHGRSRRHRHAGGGGDADRRHFGHHGRGRRARRRPVRLPVDFQRRHR